MSLETMRQTVYASLFAALTAVGAYMIVPLPLSPVPLVLQNLFVMLAGLLLGPRWGPASVGIYLLVGAMGMPVFAGARGGLAHFAGPTGGYLAGFVVCAFLCGSTSKLFRHRLPADIAGVAAGSLLVYACGIPWLKITAGLSWQKAAFVGMIPFLPGDVIKASAAVIIARAVRPMLTHRMEATPS